jgi:tRNA-dihydrouridine synthase
MYLTHLELYLQGAEPLRAAIEMRKFAGWYLRGFPGASALRKKIFLLSDIPAIRQQVTEAAGLLAKEGPPFP